MAESEAPYKVQLIDLEKIAEVARFSIMHRIAAPSVKAAKLGGQRAIEILQSKPGGTDVVAELRKRGKLKDMKPNPGATIGYSEPTAGDPWSAQNAEVSGPPVTSVLFCCTGGLNGSWQSRFKMPAKDDLLIMVHVQGGTGTVSSVLDGDTVDNQPFSGEDWIVVSAMDVAAGWHTFAIRQVSGYFRWLSTEYIQL
jgi:hypothetical protein